MLSANTPLSKRWLVLVADSGQARYFRGTPKNGFELVDVLENAKGRKSIEELTRDDPGRIVGERGLGSYSMVREGEPKSEYKRIFARELAKRMNKLQPAEKVAVVAPPKLMSEICSNLSKSTMDRLYRKLPKEIASLSEKQITEYLGVHL